MLHIELPSADDADALLVALRYLLAARVTPDAVRWTHPSPTSGTALTLAEPDQGDLFRAEAPPATPPVGVSTLLPMASHASPAWPVGFESLVRTVVMHQYPERFTRLHRMAYRLQQQPSLWHDSLDKDRLALNLMARQVSREIHRMHAFLRFRPTRDESKDDNDDDPTYVAWFEPAHHVLRAAVPFFVKRFHTMPWAILTPMGSAHWNRQTLTYGPPADPSEAPASDAGEAQWLVYYQHIFNPARVKVDAMKRSMPVRYWKHLPEAAAIGHMLMQAPERVQQMVAHADPRAAHRWRSKGHPEGI